MVLDHVDLVVYDRSVPWMHAIGAFAFPAFAVTFGAGLALSRDALAVAERLVVPALLAQAAWIWLPGPGGLNVLGVFALAALAAECYRAWPALGVACAAALLLAGQLLEGGTWGVTLVLGAWAAARWRLWWLVALASAPWLLFVPSAGVAAGLVAPHFARRLDVKVPRVPGLFAWAYAGHLVVLAGLSA
jgi:hypothetical protein